MILSLTFLAHGLFSSDMLSWQENQCQLKCYFLFCWNSSLHLAHYKSNYISSRLFAIQSNFDNCEHRVNYTPTQLLSNNRYRYTRNIRGRLKWNTICNFQQTSINRDTWFISIRIYIFIYLFWHISCDIWLGHGNDKIYSLEQHK